MGNHTERLNPITLVLIQTIPHTICRWFRVLLIVAAYGYLAYALLTFEQYGEFAAHFSNAGWRERLPLALAVLLFPLNISMESEKWRSLLWEIVQLSRKESQRQVYYGFVGALLTPDRLGDYPARASLLPDGVSKLQAIALGFTGSMVLAAVNIAAGIIALLVCGMELPNLEHRQLILLSAFLLIFFVAICCLMAFSSKCQTLQKIPKLPLRQLARVVGLSACRYLIFSLQLYCLLLFAGAELTATDCLLAIPIYYLVLTLLPALPAADPALRGGVGMVVFGAFTDNIPAVALATVLLWIINNLFSLIIGTLVRKNA